MEKLESKKIETVEGVEIIADNAGGIRIQTASYVHHYTDMDQAARDLVLLARGAETDSWEGNEPGNRQHYDADEIAAGQVQWMTYDEIASELDPDDVQSSSVRDLISAVRRERN